MFQAQEQFCCVFAHHKLLRDPREVPDKVLNPPVAESNLAQFQSLLLKLSFKICIVSAFRMPCANGCRSLPASLESTVQSAKQSF